MCHLRGEVKPSKRESLSGKGEIANVAIPTILGYCGDRFDNEHRWTPPRWARHVLSWKILGRINRHFDTCWANMVMWKLGYDQASWWPTPTCFKPYDYCGKYDGKPLPYMPDPVYLRFSESSAEKET
jgi:hypothetical protein